jgi:lysophospholipid acyltransferase (LPLAT)-like uncharacterized protein
VPALERKKLSLGLRRLLGAGKEGKPVKIRHPALIRGLGLFGAWTIRGWMSTLHYRLDDRACGPQPTDVRQQRYIYAFWHETILFLARFRAKVHILISQHADGELIAQVCRHLRVGVVRGSSRRGGPGAALELLEKSRHSHLAITPDGPRGPRRKVKPGLIFLASHCALPVLPIGIAFQKAWRAGSWDRFAVPYPGSTAFGVGAAPIIVPPHLDQVGLRAYQQLVEDRLLEVTDQAERWAAGLPRQWPAPGTLAA